MRFGSLIFVVLVASALPVSAQTSTSHRVNAVDVWVQKSYAAAMAYRSGDRGSALKLLWTLKNSEQEKAVDAIRLQIESIASGVTRKTDHPFQWTPRLLRALGSLHMEAAIVAQRSIGKEGLETVEHHLKLAIAVFDAAATLTGEQDIFAAKWILAIGLERMAEGDFATAYRRLIPSCGEKQTYAPLLIACGTVHETFASFPARQLERISSLQRDDRPMAFEMTLAHGARELGEARRNRNVQLDLAREYLDRALKLDPSSTEAQLRLAHVRLQRKDEATAADILDKLLASSSLEARERYLTILFLSRIRERQDRLDDAAALLKQTAVHQTSLIAGAHNAQRRGDLKDATTIVDRMTRLGTDDPWWSYRFGQYWLVESLFKELREEAVK